MAINDPIADMLIRIRNAANAKFPQVAIPFSKIKGAIATILKEEGFVRDAQVVGEGVKKNLVIELKYRPDGKPVFSSLKRTSKLSRRQYTAAKNIKPSRQGMGVSILTTSKGIFKDTDAKRQGVGGEIICTIW